MADYNEIDIDVLRAHSLGRFESRLPDPAELLAWGGMPGVEYAMVAGHNVPEAKELGWNLCRDVPSVTVVGPKGSCELVVMAKGEPIQGASPANGVRKWQFDPQLLSITGLPPANTAEEAAEAKRIFEGAKDLRERAALEAKLAAKAAARTTAA